MNTPKSVLLFLSGTAAGVFLSISLLNPGVPALAATRLAGPFLDVPASHVAAPAVADLKARGILTGYPDNTYHGDKPVTRYELAVTLARFAKYYDTSQAPIQSSSAQIPAAPDWAAPSRTYLVSNNFLLPDSPLFENPGTRRVTSDELANALSSLINRLTDRSMPLDHPQ
jgi:hypothetical protein